MAYEFNHYYELQNVATGKYVNVLGNHEDGTVKNGETVNLFSRTNNPDQRWALENFGGNGNVRIVLQRGEGWYALNYNTRNTNCIVWHLNYVYSSRRRTCLLTVNPSRLGSDR